MIGLGSKKPVNQASQLPQMTDALFSWFIKMTLDRITTEIINYETVETRTTIKTRGVLQPMSMTKLKLKPEGQTHWKWHTLHSDPSLNLEFNDVIVFKDIEYRVLGKFYYEDYGYFEYDLVSDWREN